MTHKFDINTLTLQSPVEKSRRFYLLIKVSETYWFRTAEQHMNNFNIIPFMQTNQFQVPHDMMIYYSVSLFEKLERGSRLLQKKLLFKRDIKKEEMTFKFEGDNVAVLNFKAVVTNNAANSNFTMIGDRIVTTATSFAEQKDASRLELMSLGILTFKFVNRLDPVVYVSNYLRQVIAWKKPLHTLFFGSCLTFFILNPSIALMIMSALVVWYKDSIFIKLENFSRETKDRIIPTDQNLKFLRNLMNWHCEFVDNAKEIIFGNDKTQFIVLLSTIISSAWVMMILPAFVSFSTMLVFALWFGLLVGLDISKAIVEFLQTIHRRPLEYIAQKMQKQGFMNNKFVRQIIAFIDKQFPGVIEVPVIKTFYVYEFQRWWLGNWGQPYKHECKWSNQKGILNVLPRSVPPAGYMWEGQWKIDINLTETDEEGFMYSSDFMTTFHKDKWLLDVLRRRKWSRVCSKPKALGNGSVLRVLSK